MARALYVVIFSREKWWIDLEGRAFGPYESREQATEEGRQMARFASHSGQICELLRPDERGRYQVVWTSENEPLTGTDRSGGVAAA